MNLGLQNKVALVLASSKGLGFACAKEFYKEGANVVICSRSEDNLDEDQIKNLVEMTLKEFGRIDILVHNAGGPPSGPIDKITKEEWSNSINLNLRSFIRITDLIIPVMENQKSGRIIAITSVSVKQPLNNLVLSNTTRLGVVGFAKTLANECGMDNILVNVVCPGPTLTDRMKDLINTTVKDTGKTYEEVEKTWVDPIPLGRLGKPEELANLIIFLASEKASFITGTVIQVDGGFVKSPF